MSLILHLTHTQGHSVPAAACLPLLRVLVLTLLALTLSLEATHILFLMAPALPGLCTSLLPSSPTLQCKPHEMFPCPSGVCL